MIHYADEYQTEDYTKTINELKQDFHFPRIRSYDFVIVGGGTAGCLLAGRLSEYFSVLLIESGGEPIPATYNHYFRVEIEYHPSFNTKFMSTPQKNFSMETEGRIDNWLGRMLGGSGSHNGNIYNRGSRHDYDTLAKLTGDDSWSYQNVLKHFKNIENYVGHLENEEQRQELYGTSGPLTIDTDNSFIGPAWFQAAAELNYDIIDPNGNQTEGFSEAPISMKNGERDSTYTAYIKPVEGNRKSLTVMKYSTVDKVLVDGNGVAYGVSYKRHGIPQIAHANKDVIISSGSYSSPVILIKSGIGPEDGLKEAEIPIVSHVPGVGKNLRDHCAVSLAFTAFSPNTTLMPRLYEEELEDELMKYLDPNTRHGYFTVFDKPQAFLVSPVAKSEGEEDWPDLQVVYTLWNVSAVVERHETTREFKLSVILNRHKSVGELVFDTDAYLDGKREANDLVLVDYRLFSEDTDVDRQIYGIKVALQLMEDTAPFQQMDVRYTEKTPEACVNITYRSDDYWRCYIQQRAMNYYHPSGTCKMGPDTDAMSVVDASFRVRGVKNLRVVDASILPLPTNANLNAAVILLAEKAASDILTEYGIDELSSSNDQ
ncbi:Glucose dehydrogenase [FAD, quinone], partial [Pseudolycoriella hygida]